MTKEEFKKIIDICSKQSEVKVAIKRNHDDNLWWPLEVKDYRKRLLIAGLSTRISYNMIHVYQNVINHLNHYSYEEIENMTKEELVDLIKDLGLSNARYRYLSSMMQFIKVFDKEIKTLSNDELIRLIAEQVEGASYKVAQCCVLYVRGYYSGIMPVDSGMKDIELPCLGFPEYKNALGHDILRKQLEDLVKDNDMEDIIKKNGYEDLQIEDYRNATWWCHLVLIYYKRYFCNKHHPSTCPLHDVIHIQSRCQKKQKDLRRKNS